MISSRQVFVALLATLITLSAMAGPASAGSSSKPSKKLYAVVVSNADASSTRPATLAGGAPGTIRVTYTNLPGRQDLGSSDLTVPAGLHLASASVAPRGTATVVGDVVRLRGLDLDPGKSATVTLQVAPDCPAASYTWDVPVTKQANDFNGSGNDFTLDSASSDLRTVVTGGCILRFLAQPASAVAGETISSAPYDQAAPPVSVEVVDANGTRVTSASIPVTLAIGANPSGGSLTGAATSTTAAGVATFSNLSIDAPGSGYRLVATSPGATADTSAPFNIDRVAVRCPEDVDCSGSLPLTQSGSSFVDVTALQGPALDTDTGFLTLNSGLGGPLDCSGYTELTGGSDVIVVDYTAPDRQKRLVATIDRALLVPDGDDDGDDDDYRPLQSCFGAPYAFATKRGTPLEINGSYVPGPYPAPEYKGLLPDCGGKAQLDDPNTAGVSGPTIYNAGPPCVVRRGFDAAHNATIETLWPSGAEVGTGDPRGRY